MTSQIQEDIVREITYLDKISLQTGENIEEIGMKNTNQLHFQNEMKQQNKNDFFIHKNLNTKPSSDFSSNNQVTSEFLYSINKKISSKDTNLETIQKNTTGQINFIQQQKDSNDKYDRNVNQVENCLANEVEINFSSLSLESLNDDKTQLDQINKTTKLDHFPQRNLTECSFNNKQLSSQVVDKTRKPGKQEFIVNGLLNEKSAQMLELIKNFDKVYTCQMDTFDNFCCISDQQSIKSVKIQDVYKIKNSENHICKPCYMRYLKNQRINLIIKELNLISYNQKNFITSKLNKLTGSEFSMFLLKNQLYTQDEKVKNCAIQETYNINQLIPQNSMVDFKELIRKFHSLQYIWLNERILFAYTNQSELDIFKLGVRAYSDKYQYQNYEKEYNKIMIAQVSIKDSQAQILSECYFKYSTDYSAIARYDRQIYIAGGHSNLNWLQYLFSYDLVSEKLVLLNEFENSLITPTLLCNKLESQPDKQIGGLQFFYLGQSDKLSKMNFYFMQDPSSEINQLYDFENNFENICLNTDSINQQLEDLNFTYSYPAIFTIQGSYLVLFGGIDIFTLETTNRLLVLDIKDFNNPKVSEINQEISEEQGKSNKDYFFGNQVFSDQFQTIHMRGEHGIYKASYDQLSNEEILISVKKIFNF
ncbi:UNKNOWN [Stylonychia lemnae]|uniref:Kelch motif family protein n=1 Tax=Stylonychia lemnae TaxID=5949 RepID=A0A077ZU04_STYLE|nr:UNKNOWN [Stylonychia lemnae]|eukprot:CDW73347.1 UNKNOWN [Stylonychia lemnae]